MPILAITKQPGSAVTALIVAAYRPIIFLVNATRTDGSQIPPVVYCDIYFNGVYYKSLSLTQYNKLNAGSTEWRFDISDAAQEYLRYNLPLNGAGNIQEAPQSVVAAFCRFRSSGFDANGFLVWEGVRPIQATGSKAAVAGTGTDSQSFYILNAVLQHEDNQDLLTHLQYARPNASYNANTYPLTHRPNGYRICKSDSDYFPFLHLGDKQLKTICISYRLKGQAGFQTTCQVFPVVCNGVVSAVVSTILAGNNVLVTFQSAGDAIVWEWRLLPGNQWRVINQKQFQISWNEFLQAIITEAGLPVHTEDGQIIIPEEVDPYAEQTVEIRPRCPNGAYGTAATGVFTILPPSACNPPIQFSFSATNYADNTIRLNVELPAGAASAMMEVRFDHGNGVVTPPMYFEAGVAGGFIYFDVPAASSVGTYKFRIRTICDPVTVSMSAWSNIVDVVWDPPVNTVRAEIAGIFTSPPNNYRVNTMLTAPVSDNLTIQGHFQGDAAGGNSPSLNFVSNSVIGMYRYQVIEIDDDVAAGNIFTLVAYGHPVSVTAGPDGLTPAELITSLIVAINTTTPAQWNSSGQASGLSHYPQASEMLQDDRLQVMLLKANQFNGGAFGGGGISTFNFTTVILAGQTTGTTLVGGAPPSGSTFAQKIDSVFPDPTSDGTDIVY